MKKTTVEGAKTTATLYLGGIEYVNDTLQFIAHEEGRVRWANHRYVNGLTKYGFEYDYFLKDHLGNVRMVLTQQKDTSQYLATMESAYRATENQLFYNIPLSCYPRSAVSGYPTDNTTVPNDSLAGVNGNGQKVGPSLLLKVMSGDIIDVATKSFYKSGGTKGANNSVLTDALNALAGGIVGQTSGSHGTITDFTTSGTPVYSAVSSFLTTNNTDPAGKPKAYLNWILLDDQFKSVTTYPQSGAIVIGSADVLNTLAYTGIPITKNGYLYIWVSNETAGWDVFFDNLSVKHYTGPISEETHYYPFGLTMAGISSKVAGGLENDKKYNGIEFDEDLDIDSYEAFYRNLDPQTGRWWQIDPKVEEGQESMSPYTSMGNDPIRYSDPLGDIPDDGGPGDPPSTATRIWGGVKAVGGLAEMAVGAVGGAAPSWTGVGAVLGGAAVVHGADVVSSGISQMFSGTETKTFTEQGISNGLQTTGVSAQTANTVAGYADAGVSIALTAGAGSVANTSEALSNTNKIVGEAKSASSTPTKVNQPVPHAKQIKSIINNASKPGVTLSDKKIDQLKRVIEAVGGKLRTEVGKIGSVKGIKHSQVEHPALGSKISHRHIIHTNQ